MRVDTFKQVLDAESLAADVLHLALVLLVDGLHDKAHQHRAFGDDSERLKKMPLENLNLKVSLC